MTGPELQAIRERLGLSRAALGRAFGYAGNEITSQIQITKFETGVRKIPIAIARLAIMFDMHGVPAGWTSRLVKPPPEEETPAEPYP